MRGMRRGVTTDPSSFAAASASFAAAGGRARACGEARSEANRRWFPCTTKKNCQKNDWLVLKVSQHEHDGMRRSLSRRAGDDDEGDKGRHNGLRPRCDVKKFTCLCTSKKCGLCREWYENKAFRHVGWIACEKLWVDILYQSTEHAGRDQSGETEKEKEDTTHASGVVFYVYVYLCIYMKIVGVCVALRLGEGDVEGARDVGGDGVDALGCERFDVNANAVLCA